MVLLLPLMLASASAAGQGGGEHYPPVLCGNVSISFKFRIVQEHATKTNCGAIGFQVRCVNSTPYLGYSRYQHWFADSHKLEKLGAALNRSVVDDDESCSIPKNNSSTKVALPFSISPVNQD
jgi:hypothetical protein